MSAVFSELAGGGALAQSALSAAQFDAWIAESRAWAERALRGCLDAAELGPPRLAEALRYAVLGDGKRVRPTLVRLACGAHGGSDAAAAPAAVALELVHAYSLVHDDLPCMDDDDLRRGRPTVHVAYDEATAVLVGDGLQALAFEHLAQHGGPRAAEAVALLARAAGPAARARSATRAACREFGVQLGLLFQAVDDVLDVTGDAATLGKTPGKDLTGGKGTAVAALGLDGARRAAQELAASALASGRVAGLDGCGLVSSFVTRMLARTS